LQLEKIVFASERNKFVTMKILFVTYESVLASREIIFQLG